MDYFLAIDAGGTKTRCALGDDRRTLAEAQCGSVKLMRVGEMEATTRLLGVMAEVSARAGVSLQSVGGTCVGLAGVSIAAVRSWAQRTIAPLVGGEVMLCGDEEIALDAAFRGGPGVLVVAGTGSNVVGRSAAGEIFRAGGWGPAVGDEGSGHWIGVEAIRRGLWARDRGVACELIEAVQRCWRLPSLAELVEHVNLRPGPQFSELVPVVVRAADGGDPVARDLLEDAGRELARQVLVAARKSGTERVACAGSVLEYVPAVRRAMVEALRESSPGIEVLALPVDPIDGALWRARRMDVAGERRLPLAAAGVDLSNVDLAGADLPGVDLPGEGVSATYTALPPM